MGIMDKYFSVNLITHLVTTESKGLIKSDKSCTSTDLVEHSIA